MISRITTSLKSRRNELDGNEKGFTLIELLVVVIIIGILAAIAIPVYMGVQNNAKDSAVKSDLTNAKIAVVGYFTANPATITTPPALDDATLGSFGFSQSDNTGTIAYGAVGKPLSPGSAFCIQAPRKDDSTVVYSITEAGGVTKAACPTS